MQAAKPCARPGCRATVDHGGFCVAHRVLRLSASERGYDVKWRRLREWVLAREPLCRTCMKRGLTVLATDVDHICPLAAGGTNQITNLQPLCHRCHSEKTVREDGGFSAKRLR